MREIGQDRIDVFAIAKGYQDPHFVDPKPSYLLKLRRADLLAVVGLELEVGWLVRREVRRQVRRQVQVHRRAQQPPAVALWAWQAPCH